MTHEPPHGVLDKNRKKQNCGNAVLLKEIQERVKPKYHVFGHVHEDYGIETIDGTSFINASTCSASARPENAPVVFDIKAK